MNILEEFDKKFADETSDFYYDSEGGYAQGNLNLPAVRAFLESAIEQSYQKGRDDGWNNYSERGAWKCGEDAERKRILEIIESKRVSTVVDNFGQTDGIPEPWLSERNGYNKALDDIKKEI